ncbi:MAG: ABC transporter permease [Deltaproteobacteria bacterium]|nr:ABC transporter permease [Deltaproteobacteria bacterium]
MFAETLRLALSSIIENRLRSFLTVLGIVFGVMAVIATTAIVNGVFTLFLTQLTDLGAGFLFAVAGNNQASERVRIDARLTSADAQDVASWSKSVKATTPFLGEVRNVRKSDRVMQAFVAPTNEHYADIQGIAVDEGRFLTSMDVRRRARVAVVGDKVVKELGLTRGVGDQIRVLGAPYTIIGVFEARDGFNALGQRYDQMIVVPLTAAPGAGQQTRGGVMLIKLKDGEDVDAAKHEVRAALRRAHHLQPGEPDDFTLVSQGEILQSVEKITTAATWVVLAIVGVALLVGGIGIMNIMLVSVTERTREIGLRMAMGARRQDIMLQFLVEASALGAAGGVVGVLFGVGITMVIGALATGLPKPDVPLWAVVLALSWVWV